ncbi:uncharacterized protein LOC110112071 [Dendrobium catenatum]|uniref:Uncharacterized protein n=1 Tax=Dendrobium catenatum TaxID=906689 RepID=A0A2I0X3B9_9ASPA|nr:uncharacterized protein LOC110112071 [Dendrobium catenatum]PKU82414.1 hypothetical protein MA16_Dca005419 [Dendrobium catenatum]
MAASLSPRIHNSPTMATSLRSLVRPFLSHNWRSSNHLLRPQSSFCLPNLNCSRLPYVSSRRAFGVFHPRGQCLFVRVLQNGVAEPAPKDTAADAELQARGDSTMPERFRHLNKEAPDRPVRWPWAIALFFLVYAWRTVLWELSNWKKAAITILSSVVWLLKLSLAYVFRLIGDPITGLIRYIEFVLYTIRYVYASIVAFAPVPELTRIIFFTSTILAIAEATVPNSVNAQPYLLTLAGIVGFGTVRGFIPEIPFWMFLFGMLFYSKFIKKRDTVSAALPSAALLAAVGEPWVRGIVITSYLALAIAQYAKYSNDAMGTEVPTSNRILPLPLLLASLAIGINLAAKWIRYRHLTWMIV